MITGFNTDIKHGTKVYHVQTEDKGRNNPKIETLVYVGGEILDNCRTSYEKDKEHLPEEQIMELLERQHKRVIRTIKVGKYDEPSPFPVGVLSDRALTEVIIDYLKTEPTDDFLKLITNGVAGLSKNGKSTLHFQALKAGSQEPISGAEVTVKLLNTGQRMRIMFKGETDASGTLAADLGMSELPQGEYSLVIQAISEWGVSHQQFPLRGRNS